MEPAAHNDFPQGQPLPQSRQRVATYGDSANPHQNPNQNHLKHVQLADQGSYAAAQQQMAGVEMGKQGYRLDPESVHSPPPQPGHTIRAGIGRDYYDAPNGTRMGHGMVGSGPGMGGPVKSVVAPGMSPAGPGMSPAGSGMSPAGPGMSPAGTGVRGMSIGGVAAMSHGGGPGLNTSGLGMGNVPVEREQPPRFPVISSSTKRRQPMSMNASDVSKYYHSGYTLYVQNTSSIMYSWQ